MTIQSQIQSSSGPQRAGRDGGCRATVRARPSPGTGRQGAGQRTRYASGTLEWGIGDRVCSRSFYPLAECQSVAAADCYQNKRDAVAAICKGKAYPDFRDLLARDDIDAVVIATPDHWHVPIGIMAARAKKDVYIEKPLGVTIEQDLAMQKAIAENTSACSSTERSNAVCAHCWTGCELVRRGAIGKVHTIEVDAPNGGNRRFDSGRHRFPTVSILTCGAARHPVRDYTSRSLQAQRNLLGLRLFHRLPGWLGSSSAGHHGLGERRRYLADWLRSKVPGTCRPKGSMTVFTTGT